MSGPKMCGVPDNVGDMSCQWPFLDVSIYAEGRAGQINLADAMELAIPKWNHGRSMAAASWHVRLKRVVCYQRQSSGRED